MSTVPQTVTRMATHCHGPRCSPRKKIAMIATKTGEVLSTGHTRETSVPLSTRYIRFPATPHDIPPATGISTRSNGVSGGTG